MITAIGSPAARARRSRSRRSWRAALALAFTITARADRLNRVAPPGGLSIRGPRMCIGIATPSLLDAGSRPPPGRAAQRYAERPPDRQPRIVHARAGAAPRQRRLDCASLRRRVQARAPSLAPPGHGWSDWRAG